MRSQLARIKMAAARLIEVKHEVEIEKQRNELALLEAKRAFARAQREEIEDAETKSRLP